MTDQSIFPASHRGITKTAWLTSRHLFSFGGWYNPSRTGFGALRVLNDDIVQPSTGFGLHGHRNMEIVSIVLSGQLKHRDDTGNEGVLREGDIQAMSAGTGIRHAELNPSDREPVHFLQLWILPDRDGHTPRYTQLSTGTRPTNGFRPIVSDGSLPDTLTINRHASLSIARLEEGDTVNLSGTQAGMGQLLYVSSGTVFSGEPRLNAGDAWERVSCEAAVIRTEEVSHLTLIEIPLL